MQIVASTAIAAMGVLPQLDRQGFKIKNSKIYAQFFAWGTPLCLPKKRKIVYKSSSTVGTFSLSRKLDAHSRLAIRSVVPTLAVIIAATFKAALPRSKRAVKKRRDFAPESLPGAIIS